MDRMDTKLKLSLLPFLVLLIVYPAAIYWNTAYDEAMKACCYTMIWAPFAICLLYFISTRMRNLMLTEIGTVLHTLFACFLGGIYYLSVIRPAIFGFIRKSIPFYFSSILLWICIVLIFFLFKRTRRDCVVKQG